MGSEEMNKMLRDCIDEGTNGLLTDYTKDIKMDPETVLALVSTLYYKAAWADKFYEDQTKDMLFHGASGDKDVKMMHRDASMQVYDFDKFNRIILICMILIFYLFVKCIIMFRNSELIRINTYYYD